MGTDIQWARLLLSSTPCGSDCYFASALSCEVVPYVALRYLDNHSCACVPYEQICGICDKSP